MRVLSLIPALYAALCALVAPVSAFRAESRDLLPSIDTCAYVDTNVFVLFDLPVPTGRGHIQVCLCASTVRPHVQVTAVTNLLVERYGERYGEDAVVNALVNLVTRTGMQCHYPAHAHPICQQSAPCDFGCQDGYSKSQDGQCICQAPKIECNGRCQTQACSSSVPQVRVKRDMSGLTPRSRMLILTEERCPAGHVLCGAGASRRRHEAEWECIDIRSTLDSCGGCMFPFLLDERPVTGTDCTALPGVSSVQCHVGRCLVNRCKRGWSIAPSGSGCISDDSLYNSTL